MSKIAYRKPMAEFIRFDNKDIITTSTPWWKEKCILIGRDGAWENPNTNIAAQCFGWQNSRSEDADDGWVVKPGLQWGMDGIDCLMSQNGSY